MIARLIMVMITVILAIKVMIMNSEYLNSINNNTTNNICGNKKQLLQKQL